MEKSSAGSEYSGPVRSGPQADPADVSDFIRLAGQVAFQSTDDRSEDGNKRAEDRRNYPFLQRIAPVLNGAMPAAEQFREVPFSDISAAGASFLWEGSLGFEYLVVELGAGSNVSLVAARVAWVERLEPSSSDSFILRVGCRLTGLADPGASH